jgi:hypothetical protein
MDRATRRWIERDPEEAGFSRYFTAPDPQVEAYLRPDPAQGPLAAVRRRLLFTAGNHEDYAFLESLAKRGPAEGAPGNTFSVDCYGAFHCIHNGRVARIRSDGGAELRVAALWGIEQSRPLAPYRMSREAAGALEALGRGAFDLLLTHDVPDGVYPGHRGSTLVTEVLRACDPPFHLFGHAHPFHGQHEFLPEGLQTRCWIFEDLGFGKKGDGTLEGAMGLLDWDGRRGTIEKVGDPWLRRMRQETWMYVDGR